MRVGDAVGSRNDGLCRGFIGPCLGSSKFAGGDGGILARWMKNVVPDR